MSFFLDAICFHSDFSVKYGNRVILTSLGWVDRRQKAAGLVTIDLLESICNAVAILANHVEKHAL